jgi:type II secretory pathway pseudopilin PulG
LSGGSRQFCAQLCKSASRFSTTAGRVIVKISGTATLTARRGLDRNLPCLGSMFRVPARLRSPRNEAGFTLLEALAVCAVVGIVAAVAVPQTNTMMTGYRLKGSAQSLNNVIGLARMRASARFSRARVRADLTARTFQLQIWDKTNNQWVTEGGVEMLAPGTRFGVGSIAVPPPNTQNAIGQSPVCTDDGGADIADTACVTFNSRGMPVQNSRPPAGTIVGNNALYITDGSAVYGTTITITPLIRLWWSVNADNRWVRQ